MEGNGSADKVINDVGPFATELSEKEEAEAFSFAFSILNGSILLPVLRAVIDLGVLHIISNQCGLRGRMSASEIASKLPTTNPEAAAMLGRMLDFLVTFSILTVDPTSHPGGAVERCYGLTPVCKFFLPDKESGVSLASFCNRAMFDTLINSSMYLKDAILEGGSVFTKANGVSYYEYDSKHPEHQEGFHKAMSHHSTLVISKMLTTYKGFEQIWTLVDVGGGNGTTLHMILSKYPTIKAINFDLPHVVANAPPFPGVEHVGGDLFDNLPKGDAIFIKWICHGLSDEICIKLLKNCYNALTKDNGKVILYESLLPEASETNGNNIVSNSVIHLDMIMMVLPGGRERTQKEYKELAIAAGFQGFQVVCSVYNAHIMELTKNSN